METGASPARKDEQVKRVNKQTRRVRSRKEDWIADQLERVYGEALTDPIPDDMMSLLDQLDDVEKEGDERS